MAGFNTRALIEKDKHCCSTIRSNARQYFPHAIVLETNIQRLTVAELRRRIDLPGSLDLVSGGPPCQSFSISKIPKGGRVRDPRDELLRHFVRFVKNLKPRAFIFENVPGLLSRSEGRIFKDLTRQFLRIGYVPTVGIMNAADFGVPQLRRRLFVVGCSDGHRIDFPTPTHNATGSDGLRRHISIGETLSPLSNHLPNSQIPRNTPAKKKMLAKMVPGGRWTHWRHRDRWADPSRCLTAHCRDEWVHPIEPRAGSVRELATLQTFPSQYVFRGPINSCNNSTDSFQYRQVGNAVPVRMARFLGRTLASHLDWC